MPKFSQCFESGDTNLLGCPLYLVTGWFHLYFLVGYLRPQKVGEITQLTNDRYDHEPMNIPVVLTFYLVSATFRDGKLAPFRNHLAPFGRSRKEIPTVWISPGSLKNFNPRGLDLFGSEIWGHKKLTARLEDWGRYLLGGSSQLVSG